jgi:hypothetical protein
MARPSDQLKLYFSTFQTLYLSVYLRRGSFLGISLIVALEDKQVVSGPMAGVLAAIIG